MYVPQTLSKRQVNVSLLTGPPAPGSSGVFDDVPMFQTSRGLRDAAWCSAGGCSYSKNTKWITGLSKLGHTSPLQYVILNAFCLCEMYSPDFTQQK
jgi:hypothetical protein